MKKTFRICNLSYMVWGVELLAYGPEDSQGLLIPEMRDFDYSPTWLIL